MATSSKIRSYEMELGLYERLVSKVVQAKLNSLNQDEYFILDKKMEQEEASRFLSNHIIKLLRVALGMYSGKEILSHQISLANKIVKLIAEEVDDAGIESNLIEVEGKILLGVYQRLYTEMPDVAERIKEIMPHTRLSQSELFTGSNLGISLDSEMKKEISSSDEVCILVSFIRFSGIRIFQKELIEFANSGGKLKVITTSYMGATDFKAIQFLSNLKNAEIKISYNTTNERLHAKAYLFLRNTGFDTGYIGSSNISHSALTNGLEWNIKITTQEVPHLIDKFKKTFDSYWMSNDFETFRPGLDEEKFKRALKSEKSYDQIHLDSFFDIKPYTYQKEILDTISTERELHNNFRNLIVAATGTGKTVISAFDYKRFREENKRSRLLFVAHRKEILEQALAKFRGVLRDNNFGDLWVDGLEPLQFDHVFASVQTLRNRIVEKGFSEDYFDYIIIDEVHHIAASSYRPILDMLCPIVLLGLTATPDRNDGANILTDFNNKITADIRLPEALDRKLLCPFHYFGITDAIDLSNVRWVKGRYVPSELSKIYTQNDQRVGSIIQNLQKYVADINDVTAIAFCVTQDHAMYMAEKFTLANLKADYLVSKNSNSIERRSKRIRLINGEINYLFVVDIFNEGIDIPEIDTILFLRPTESLTVFLQQLGRGLRLVEGKDCLTVLDFVGNSRPEYDYQSKFRAIVGKTNASILSEIESDFPRLPLGCSIVLERIAKQNILNNIKNATNFSRRRLTQLISIYKQQTELDLTISNFIDFYHIPLQVIYQRGGWTRLLMDAGVIEMADIPILKSVSSGIHKKWLSCSSYSYFTFIIQLAEGNFDVNFSVMSRHSKLMLMMLYYDLWREPNLFDSIEDSFAEIAKYPFVVEEIKQVAVLLRSQIRYVEKPLETTYQCPLMIHARYTRSQILAAFDQSTFSKKSSAREGSLNIKEKNTELLFVTLEKVEEHYSPSTLYDDYAISEKLFHWQSQNSTRPSTLKGQSYINQRKNKKTILLFVREKNKDEYGNTFGFVLLGKVNYVSHYGSQPMSITWELESAIPNFLWKESAKMALA